MAALPEINYQKVAQRLSPKLGEAQYQAAQLEILAEALRDERDAALIENDNLRSQLSELQNELSELKTVTEDNHAV